MLAGVEIVLGLFSVMVHGQLLSNRIKDSIIREVFSADPALAASAIRLSFHDCVGKFKLFSLELNIY